ncbi:MAG: protease complex subunit PrcB family protein [Rubrobacteraceae bacterium]
MIKGLTTLALALLFTVGFAAGCAGGDGNGGGNGGAGDSSTGATNVPSETSRTSTTAKETTEKTEGTSEANGGTTVSPTVPGTEGVSLEQVSSGAMGPERRQILISTSAQDLSVATGLQVPESGEGTYVAVAWGEKPTGGYTVDFGTASQEGARVTTGVELKPPPEDAMVSQALTYPYAIAFLPGVDAGEKQFIFVAQNGREIGWPVRNV